MQKIGASTASANASGEFTEGNPGAGVAATLLKAAWLNAIQRELVHLIEGAGLTLDAADDSQVLKAIQVIQASANTWLKLNGKPTTIAGFGITDAFTKAETTSAIQQRIADLVASSPAALDTLKELADALGNDPNFATTMTNALAGKQKALGFAPVQQGTGIGQSSNVVKIGWGGNALKLTVDETDFGSFLLSSSFNPADFIKKGQVLNPGESLTCTSTTTGTVAGTSSNSGGFEARGNATGAAVLSFHRPGSFGVNFGLDTDNQLKVGGWSMGGVAHTIWHSGNRPRDTASLGPAGWSKNADTGEIVQWIEVPVNDFQHGRLINITWPFQFPTQFLNAITSFRQASSSGAFCGQVVYSAGTQAGCTLRMEEWAGVLQDGLVVIVTARGF